MKLISMKLATYFLFISGIVFIFPDILLAQGSTESDIYCTAYSGCNIFINSINISDLTNNGTGCSVNGFGNYTPQIVNLSLSQAFNVNVSTTATASNSICKVWIDWNQDADFTDDGESHILTNITGSGQFYGTILVPSDAYLGNTRIRIRVGLNNVNPCGYIAQGETEDYTVSVHNLLTIDSVNQSTFCGNDSIIINCNPGLTFETGNHFILQLSSEEGLFNSPVNIGEMEGVLSGTVSGFIPLNTPSGTGYRVRVVSTNPVAISSPNINDLTIYQSPLLQCNNPLTYCIPAYADLTTLFIDVNNVAGEVTYWEDLLCTLSLQNPSLINESGTYYIKKTADQGGCSAIIPAVITFGYPPSVEAGPDHTIDFGYGTIIQASVNGGTGPFSFSWDPVEGLDDPYSLQPLANPEVTTVYHLYVTDPNGCVGTDSTRIEVQYIGSGSLSGVIQYDNSNETALGNINVELKSGDVTILTTATNASGEYEFLNIPAGNFSVVCSTSRGWGGGNAIDALMIMKYFTGVQTVSGLKLVASDVNTSGDINAVDALLVMKRFVSLIESFESGDWYFEPAQVTILSGSSTNQNIKGICFGDIDGSLIPAP